MEIKKGDTIRNKKSKNFFIVCDVFHTIDIEKDFDGLCYHLMRVGGGGFKYVNADAMGNYETEFEYERRKADIVGQRMKELCARHNGVAPITPNIIGKLFDGLEKEAG